MQHDITVFCFIHYVKFAFEHAVNVFEGVPGSVLETFVLGEVI